MTGPSRVFVNGVGLDVPAGATALDAVRGWSADVADAVVRGESIITDSRGLPAPADAPIQAGAIFRVIPVRDRPAARDRLAAGDRLAARDRLAADSPPAAAARAGREES